MVATAENTQMTQWRSVHADWAAANPIPADGEFVWASDIKVLKIGDGVTAYNSLPKLYDGTISFSELSGAVDAANAAAAAADGSAQNAAQSNGSVVSYALAANDAAVAALANQQLARDYAVGPPGTVLPTGGDSASVSAKKAADIALETRNIRMADADTTVSRTLASGDLFREHDCTNTGGITLTVPAGLFTSIDRKKAWAVFRQTGIGGTITVQAASGGSNLVAPQILKSGTFGVRSADVTTAGTSGNVKSFVLGSLPAVTAGRLVVIGSAIWNVTAANTLTVSSDAALAWTVRRAQPDPATPVLVPSWTVFDTPLTTFPGGDVNFSMDPSVGNHFLGGFWFVLEGTVAGQAPTIVVATSAGVAASVSATLTALPASSQVLAVSAQRDNATTNAHASFSTNLVRIGAPGSTAVGGGSTNPDGVSDFNATKNMVYGRGSGVPSVTGDFVVNSNFNIATDESTTILVSYGPKTVSGGGAVNLQLEGGRATMSIQHGEMMLKFLPDGVTVQVQTDH